VKEERIRSIALGLTLTAHFAFLGGVWVAGKHESMELLRRASIQEEQFQHIEAGLAVRSKSAKGRKTKQPQKDSKHKVSPTDVVVSKDDQARPEDKDKKKDEHKPDDELDPESVFKKHREGADSKPSEDPAVAETGSDEESKAGQANGSDFGMFDDAKGDPYLGELNGRVHANYEVPSTVPEGEGLKALGCVKLSPDGKKVQFTVEEKSPNATLNSAVLRSLRTAPDMEQPVPSHLVQLLVEQGICFEFHH